MLLMTVVVSHHSVGSSNSESLTYHSFDEDEDDGGVAPNDTSYTRDSCHSVLENRCANCVDPS